MVISRHLLLPITVFVLCDDLMLHEVCTGKEPACMQGVDIPFLLGTSAKICYGNQHFLVLLSSPITVSPQLPLSVLAEMIL